jgi:hypothetical protein
MKDQPWSLRSLLATIKSEANSGGQNLKENG